MSTHVNFSASTAAAHEVAVALLRNVRRPRRRTLTVVRRGCHGFARVRRARKVNAHRRPGKRYRIWQRCAWLTEIPCEPSQGIPPLGVKNQLDQTLQNPDSQVVDWPYPGCEGGCMGSNHESSVVHAWARHACSRWRSPGSFWRQTSRISVSRIPTERPSHE